MCYGYLVPVLYITCTESLIVQTIWIEEVSHNDRTDGDRFDQYTPSFHSTHATVCLLHLPRHHQCTTVLHLEKIRRCLLRLLVITLNVFLRHCTVLLMTAQSVKPANVRAAILYQKNANYMSINTATRRNKTIVDVCCLIVGLKQRADLLNQRMHHHQFRCRLMFRLHPYFSTTQR